MLIEEYLQIRIQSAECILAGEELAGNVPKAMAEKAAIAELRGVEAFLNNASEEVANNSASDNTAMFQFLFKIKTVLDSGSEYLIVPNFTIHKKLNAVLAQQKHS